MKNIDKYTQQSIKFDTYMNKLADVVQKEITKGLSQGRSPGEIHDSIYKTLTKMKFDTNAFEFVWRSVKIEKNITKAKYEKEFIKAKVNTDNGIIKINLYDNIDNKAASDRIFKRFEKEYQIAKDRMDRLERIKKTPDRFTDKQTSWELRRSINTIKTDYMKVRGDINNLKHRSKNTSDMATKGLIKDRITELNMTMKSTQSTYNKLNKSMSLYEKNVDGMSSVVKGRRLSRIADAISKDIQDRKIPSIIKDTVNASAGSPVKSVAKTETASKAFQNDLIVKEDLKSSVSDEEVVMAQYSLNPGRTWLGEDECDDFAAKDNGWGEGIYMADDVPSVPIHVNCGCEVTFFTMKKSEL